MAQCSPAGGLGQNGVRCGMIACQVSRALGHKSVYVNGSDELFESHLEQIASNFLYSLD